MVRAPFTHHARCVRLFAFIASGIAAVDIQAAEPAASATAISKRTENKQNTEIDVSSEVRAWNAGKYSPPSTDFRPGTVSANKASPTVVTTGHRYTIKLPSGAPIPTLTVHGGKLYASGGFHSREFYCFAAASDKLLWAVDLDDDGPTSAVIEDDVIVFNTESCTIFALDANSGKMLWSWFLGDPLGSTPTICKGRVFTAYPATAELRQPQSPAADAKSSESKPSATGPAEAAVETPPPTHVLACFDLKTDKVLWQRWIDSDVMSAPVAVKDELYLTSFGGAVYRFNQADGAVLSVRNARATSAPVLVDDNVFVTRRADDGSGKKVEEAIVKLDRRLTVERFVAARKVAPHLDVVVQANSKYAKQSLGLGASNGIAGGGFGGGGAFDVADGTGEKPKSENAPMPIAKSVPKPKPSNCPPCQLAPWRPSSGLTTYSPYKPFKVLAS